MVFYYSDYHIKWQVENIPEKSEGTGDSMTNRGNGQKNNRHKDYHPYDRHDFHETREKKETRETRETREKKEAREKNIRAGDGVAGREADREEFLSEYEKRNADADGVIEGRNAVLEALRAGMNLDKIYIQKGLEEKALGKIASAGRAAGAVVVDADKRKLDAMSRTHAHQGVIAMMAVRAYADLNDLFQRAETRGETPLFVICDELSDPHNLGAVIRTAECAGAHGVIIPKRRSAGLNAVTAKASAGAVAHLPVARVANIPALLADLKKRGLWIFGADISGDRDLYHADLKGPAAIVIGNEGTGMTRLVSERCDFLVKIPMFGHLNSLNASAAAAVMLYEAVRQRHAFP